MSRQNLQYSLILVAAITLVIVVEVLTPKPIDWTATYSQHDKNPYGSFTVFERLPDLFPGNTVASITTTLYERRQADSLTPGNYIFVNQSFNPGTEDLNVLLDLVHEGSQAFIAAEYFAGKLEDTLQLSTENQWEIADSIGVNLVAPELQTDSLYNFRHVYGGYVFTQADTTLTPYQVLGVNQQQNPNFVRVPFGKGNFYLSTLPLAYTNYNMLYRHNADYAAKTLSYLPVQPTFWNEHYSEYQAESQSPFRFIISQAPLRWALYIAVAAVLLFMAFEAKRRQRIIPVVQPLTNTTLEFTQTVGRLYYQYKDHKNIAEKKITYFLDYIRAHFHLRTSTIDEAFYSQLAEKSGVASGEIIALFQLIAHIHSRGAISEEELLKLNAGIESFQAQAGTGKT
jgi:hypothetical protein